MVLQQPAKHQSRSTDDNTPYIFPTSAQMATHLGCCTPTQQLCMAPQAAAGMAVPGWPLASQHHPHHIGVQRSLEMVLVVVVAEAACLLLCFLLLPL